MTDTELDIDDLCATITESMSADDRQTRAQYQAACSALDTLRGECEKLRARVAELEQAHAEQAAEREHLDAIYRSAKRALASHQFEKLEDAKRHIAALEAERARQAKGDKP